MTTRSALQMAVSTYINEHRHASMRIDRRCPRCGKHRYHRMNLQTRMILCAECGASWRGKLRRKDMGLD